LRREAAECRRLLVDGVTTEEGVKRLLRQHALTADTLAEQLEAAGDIHKRKRDIDAVYRADMRRRVSA